MSTHVRHCSAQSFLISTYWLTRRWIVVSFAPNPEWSSFYASGSEIWRYIKNTVDQYNLARDMKFKHRVTAANFDESKGQWDLQIEHEKHIFTEHCNILISATGFLSRWKWPQINGLHSFQGGPVVHSASWDEEYDFTGKRIAVIGNGSSGIQIVPEMARVGSKVVNFARSGTWILAGLGNRIIDGRANYIYSEEEKHRFREDIDALKAYRKEIQRQSFSSFSIVRIKKKSGNTYSTFMDGLLTPFLVCKRF